MRLAAQIFMAAWLASLVLLSARAAIGDELPFVVAFDRGRQRQILWGLCGGAAAEALTLWCGSFWS